MWSEELTSRTDSGKQGEAKGGVEDWKLLQKPVRLLRAAAGSLTHLPQGTWMRLAALHIDCLKQLSAHMVVSCPHPCCISIEGILVVGLAYPKFLHHVVCRSCHNMWWYATCTPAVTL